MSQTRLYCTPLAVGSVTLSAAESHHAAVVRRAKNGDEVVLFDGAGAEASGRIARPNRRAVVVDVEQITHHPPDLAIDLTLAVALGKAQRQSYVIEKCTELGVGAIWPLGTDRSVSRPGAATVEKWNRRAIEAAKQSRRRWLPQITAARALTDAAAAFDQFDYVAFADTEGTRLEWDRAVRSLERGSRVLVLIGPEGGWSAAERSQLEECGAAAICLAPTVLRTETAAVAACAAVSLRAVALRVV